MTAALDTVGTSGTAPPGETDSVPATVQQAGIWSIHAADPACGAYHIVLSAKISSTTTDSLAAVVEAATELIEAHPALRLAFESDDDGGIRQRVDRSVQPVVRSATLDDATDAHVRDVMRADAREPFDLTTPPLWRLHVYRWQGRLSHVMLVAHHIAYDPWSIGLLVDELRQRLAGAALPATDAFGFANQVVAQRHFLDAPESQSSIDEAARRLSGANTALELHVDKPRPPESTFNGGTVPLTFDATTTQAIRDLAKAAKTTPYVVSLAAYFVFLSRLTGQDDLLVGTPAAGRLTREAMVGIGNYVNTIVVRGQVDEGRSFGDLVEKVRAQVLAAVRDQRIPFPTLVRAVAPPRDRSRTALFQAGFAWDTMPKSPELAPFFSSSPDPEARLSVGGFEFAPFTVPQQEGQADLWVELGSERDGQFVGVLRYNTDIYEPATAASLGLSLATTVSTLVTDSSALLRDTPRSSAGAHETWAAGPATAIAADRSTVSMIAERVQFGPDETAVEYEGFGLSYAELWDRSAEIVRDLRARGISRRDVVGLSIDRGTDLVAAIVAVLRCGATYVPLDPNFPPDRLQYMVADAGVEVLLASPGRQLEWVPDGTTVVTVKASQPAALGVEPLGDLPDDDLDDLDALAYVLYTSGSTGRPKGVEISNGALSNLLSSFVDETGFGPGDRLLAVTTVSFDIAALELLMPLVAGGTVIVCPRHVAADAIALGKAIEATRPTWMQATPTTWAMLRDSEWRNPRVNVLCGGEAVSADLAGYLVAHSLSVRNVYGPTETTIWSSSRLLEPGRPVDIGRPIRNTSFDIVDSYGRTVEPHFPGELHIGGRGVARGYHGRDDLTAERFYADGDGQRWYRTGDGVRRTGDGAIVFHGRLDSQVKVRGYRIELGEVEAAMERIAGVSRAAVAVHDDQLVGYLTADDTVAPTSGEIRAALATTLPAYMVPAAVVVLPALPLTNNNKVDRNRLPKPHFESSATFEPPRDAVEIELTKMWQQVLQVPQVGIRDDFFELGGHSLLVVKLTTAINRKWSLNLSDAAILTHPSVVELAPLVRSGKTQDAPAAALTLRNGSDDERPIHFFHPFGGTVFCYVELARALDTQRTVYALQSAALVEGGDVQVDVVDIVSDYLETVKANQPTGPYTLAGWCFGGVLAYEAARQLIDAGDEVDVVVAIDSRAPIAENVPESADDATLLSWFARDLAIPLGKTLTIEPGELQGFSVDDALDLILRRAVAADVVPADYDRRTFTTYLEAYLANGMALQSYLPEQHPGISVCLFEASDEAADYGESLGWGALLDPANLRTFDAPGDHNSVMYPPNIHVVAAEFSAILKELE